MRREWIEMPSHDILPRRSSRSPTLGWEGIEMGYEKTNAVDVRVSLHAEGVD